MAFGGLIVMLEIEAGSGSAAFKAIVLTPVLSKIIFPVPTVVIILWDVFLP